MSTETVKHNMVLTRVFDAPVEQVWQAWSDPDQVKRWWGPAGFTAPVAKMDFREGGSSLVCMKAPAEYGGQEMYNTWTYSKIVPLERIEYILNFTGPDGKKLEPTEVGLPAGIPMDVPHVVTFKPLGSGRTEVTVTEYGYSSEQVVEMSRSGMSDCLDKMAAIFEK